jgi:hypothetical protein
VSGDHIPKTKRKAVDEVDLRECGKTQNTYLRRRMMKRLIGMLSILVLSAMVTIGCSQKSPTAPNTSPEKGSAHFSMAAGDNIASGVVTLTKGAITHALPITITNNTGTIQFNGIQVGTWLASAQLYDAGGDVIYSGSGTAVVTNNGTTLLTIKVIENTGNLEIIVNVSLDIVYTSYPESGGRNILVMDSLGGGITNITNSTYDDAFANTYRGGNKLVFRRDGYLWTMNLNGSQQTNLNILCDRPRWSWNGSKIAAETNTGGNRNIFTIDNDGSNYIEITDLSTSENNPIWTADNRIVYVERPSISSASCTIRIMNADGSNKVTIAGPFNGDVYTVDVKADGTILYTWKLAGYFQLHKINIDASGQYQLTTGNTFKQYGHFSPDGSKIVYQDRIDENECHIKIMNSDGTNSQEIKNGGYLPFFIY